MSTLFFPKINPVRIYRQNYELPPGQNHAHLTTAMFTDLIYNFQEKVKYYHKWQTTDFIAFQVASDSGIPNFELVDCKGNTIAVATITSIPTPTNILPIVYYWANIDLVAVPEGYYYITGTVNGTSFYISEPIEVAELHENTIWMRYTASQNTQDAIFANGEVFYMRIDGTLVDFQPSSDSTTFEDDGGQLQVLDFNAWESCVLLLGGPEGVPNWMPDIVNRVFSNLSVQLDNKGYVRDDKAKFEATRERLYPLGGWALSIRETNPQDAIVFIDDNPVERQPIVGYVADAKLFGGVGPVLIQSVN